MLGGTSKVSTSEESSQSRSLKAQWQPESLFDYLLAGDGHEALLKFLGIENARYQPSELHVGKQIPDRVFWDDQNLHVLDLKIEINSRELARLDVKRSVARLYYIDHGPFPEEFMTKYEAALQNVVLHVFSILEPSPTFQKLLRTHNVRWYSLEEGKASAIPLDYTRDPLPLVIADLRSRIKNVSQENREMLKKLLESLSSRPFTPPEKLFLHRYNNLLKFPPLMDEMIEELVEKLKEVTILTETELKQILKENLYLLSPEERLAGLKPEERLAGLKPEERLAGLKPEELERLIREAQRKLQEEMKKKRQR